MSFGSFGGGFGSSSFGSGSKGGWSGNGNQNGNGNSNPSKKSSGFGFGNSAKLTFGVSTPTLNNSHGFGFGGGPAAAKPSNSNSFGSGFGGGFGGGNFSHPQETPQRNFTFGSATSQSPQFTLGNRSFRIDCSENWGRCCIIAETNGREKWKFKAEHVSGADVGIPDLSSDRLLELLVSAVRGTSHDLKFAAGFTTSLQAQDLSADSISSLRNFKSGVVQAPGFGSITNFNLVLCIEIVNRWKSQFVLFKLLGCEPEMQWGNSLSSEMKEPEVNVEQLANDVREMHDALREMQTTVTRLIGTVRTIAASRNAQETSSRNPQRASSSISSSAMGTSTGFSFSSAKAATPPSSFGGGFDPAPTFKQPNSSSSFSTPFNLTESKPTVMTKSNVAPVNSFSFGSSNSFGSASQTTGFGSFGSGGFGSEPVAAQDMSQAFSSFDNNFAEYHQDQSSTFTPLTLLEEDEAPVRRSSKKKSKKKKKEQLKLVACPECKTEFATASALKVHSRIHVKTEIEEPLAEQKDNSAAEQVVENEPGTPTNWFYVDQSKIVQGPFPGAVMKQWYTQGFLKADLAVGHSAEGPFEAINAGFRDGRTLFLDAIPEDWQDEILVVNPSTIEDTNLVADIGETTEVADMADVAQVDPHCPGRERLRVYEANGTVYSAVLNQMSTIATTKNQGKFYILQVLVNPNDEFFVFFRWGRLTSNGQTSFKPCKTMEAAVAEFSKKFRDKTRNNWEDRENFEFVPNKYHVTQTWSSAEAPGFRVAENSMSAPASSEAPSLVAPNSLVTPNPFQF